MNIPCIFDIFLAADRPKLLRLQHRRKPDDRIQRRAQLMADIRQKLRLRRICRHRLRLRFLKLAALAYQSLVAILDFLEHGVERIRQPLDLARHQRQRPRHHPQRIILIQRHPLRRHRNLPDRRQQHPFEPDTNRPVQHPHYRRKQQCKAKAAQQIRHQRRRRRHQHHLTAPQRQRLIRNTRPCDEMLAPQRPQHRLIAFQRVGNRRHKRGPVRFHHLPQPEHTGGLQLRIHRYRRQNLLRVLLGNAILPQ